MKRIICAVLLDRENHEGSFNIVLGYCAFQYGILAMLASGCVFADTAVALMRRVEEFCVVVLACALFA